MRRAVSFLTVVGGPVAPSPQSLPWFPVVGALLGLAIGGVWAGARHAGPLVVAAALAVAADAVLTGALHWDGLADTGDGLLPPLPRERRLAVMADPRTGAFGVVAVGCVLLLRFAALSAGPVNAWVVAGLWSGSRAGVAVVAMVGRYARADGIATAFVGDGAQRRARATATGALGLLITLPLTLVHRPVHGAAALGAELLVIAAVTWLAARRLGGYTGDVLGAQIVMGETAGLLVWAARW